MAVTGLYSRDFRLDFRRFKLIIGQRCRFYDIIPSLMTGKEGENLTRRVVDVVS
jgi:hypothetical protein